MDKAGNTVLAHSGGQGTLSFFSNKNINIYPKSPIFISDQVIYQWKEEKNADWNENTKDSEKRLIHP